MAVESESFTELADEFALVAETAAEAGVPAGALPRVRRSWVNVPAGGHVSGVFWGDGPPELVFLHDIGDSARRWDAVVLAAGRPAVAIDLPGHGRSDWRRDGRYEPAKLAPAVAEAIRSFAPRVVLVAGTAQGGSGQNRTTGGCGCSSAVSRTRTSCGGTRRPSRRRPKIENLLAFCNEKVDIVSTGCRRGARSPGGPSRLNQ